MHSFCSKGLAAFVLPLILALLAVLGLGCEDENKEICCQCTCYTIVNATTGEQKEETVLARGKNISCESECRSQCNLMNWEIRYHAKVKCPKETAGDDDTAQQ